MELKKVLTTLDSSLSSAVGGSSELYKGSQSLTAGLQKVDQEQALAEWIAVISSGAVQLYDASTLLRINRRAACWHEQIQDIRY